MFESRVSIFFINHVPRQWEIGNTARNQVRSLTNTAITLHKHRKYQLVARRKSSYEAKRKRLKIKYVFVTVYSKGIKRASNDHMLASLVGTTSNRAGAIIRAREALLVTRLLVGARRLGRASGALLENITLVDSILVVGLCWARVSDVLVEEWIAVHVNLPS